MRCRPAFFSCALVHGPRLGLDVDPRLPGRARVRSARAGPEQKESRRLCAPRERAQRPFHREHRKLRLKHYRSVSVGLNTPPKAWPVYRSARRAYDATIPFRTRDATVQRGDLGDATESRRECAVEMIDKWEGTAFFF